MNNPREVAFMHRAIEPTLAPFRSNAWPRKTDPAQGAGPARLEDVP